MRCMSYHHYRKLASKSSLYKAHMLSVRSVMGHDLNPIGIRSYEVSLCNSLMALWPILLLFANIS